MVVRIGLTIFHSKNYLAHFYQNRLVDFLPDNWQIYTNNINYHAPLHRNLFLMKYRQRQLNQFCLVSQAFFWTWLRGAYPYTNLTGFDLVLELKICPIFVHNAYFPKFQKGRIKDLKLEAKKRLPHSQKPLRKCPRPAVVVSHRKCASFAASYALKYIQLVPVLVPT